MGDFGPINDHDADFLRHQTAEGACFNLIWEDFVMQLHGKRVVIIGGSSGIGLETARLALAEGAFVTIAGRSEERLRRASESFAPAGERLRAVVADLSEESSVRSLFAGESRVDHVFVPAGELRPGGGDLMKADVDAMRSILEVRVLGIAHVVRQARRKMEGGSITLMSGLYSTRPAPGVGMAVAALGAVEALTRALALDLAPIRVNAVAPGVTDTPSGIRLARNARQSTRAGPRCRSGVSVARKKWRPR
jgi:NAD(P)-dependent dehydrogenase (short-subunit alcohol dehydrogenase family)